MSGALSVRRVELTAGGPSTPTRRAPLQLTMDESTAGYVVAIDVGEFVEPELEVTLTGRLVTVSAEPIDARAADMVVFRIDGRRTTSFQLPDDADPLHVDAVYRNGTLEIRARKMTAGQRRIVPIRHESVPS